MDPMNPLAYVPTSVTKLVPIIGLSWNKRPNYVGPYVPFPSFPKTLLPHRILRVRKYACPTSILPGRKRTVLMQSSRSTALLACHLFNKWPTCSGRETDVRLPIEKLWRAIPVHKNRFLCVGSSGCVYLEPQNSGILCIQVYSVVPLGRYTSDQSLFSTVFCSSAFHAF
jgi:hypothetical protein